MFADLAPDAPYYVSAWLFTYVLHSTALITGAWLAAVVAARLACRSASLRAALPALREKLWKFALVGGLVTASVQTAVGIDPWGGRIALRTAVVASSDATPAELASGSPLAAAPARDTESFRAPSHATAQRESTPSAAHGIQREPLFVLDGTQLRGEAEVTRPRVAPSLVRTAHASTHGDVSGAVTEDGVPSTTVTPPGAVHDALTGRTNGWNESTARTPSVVHHVPEASRAGAVTWYQRIEWVHVVLAVWLAGVAFGAARWICQWNRLLRDIDDRAPVESGTVFEVYQHLRTRAALRANVRLSMAPGLRAPITLGIRDLEIVLPPRVETELQRDEIAALLAHELAHVRRRDPAWLAVCRFVEVVFFFQPLNKRCTSWLSDEAEYLCDDWAVVQVGERVALASCLTEIAGWIVHGREPRLASGMAAAGTRLSLRVGRLLDEDHDPARAPRTRWVAAALVPVATCVAVLVPRVAADVRVDAPATENADVAASEARTDRAVANEAAPRGRTTAESPAGAPAAPEVRASPQGKRPAPTPVLVALAPVAIDTGDGESRAKSAGPRVTKRVVTTAEFEVRTDTKLPDATAKAPLGAGELPESVELDELPSSYGLDELPSSHGLDELPASHGLDELLESLEDEIACLRDELESRVGGAELGARLRGLERRVANLRERAAAAEERIAALTSVQAAFDASSLARFFPTIIPDTQSLPSSNQE